MTGNDPQSFFDRPLVRFLTLRYAMGPMQFFIAEFVTFICFVACLPAIGAIFALLSADAVAIGSLLLLLAAAWLAACLSGARLLDAGIWRVATVFTGAIPGILLFYVAIALNTGLGIGGYTTSAVLLFWIIVYFALSTLPRFWRLAVIPLALIQNYLQIVLLPQLALIKGPDTLGHVMPASFCFAYILLMQLLLFLLPSRRLSDGAAAVAAQRAATD